MDEVKTYQSKPELYMTVGLPGSGKSTWANVQKENNIVLSSDQLRIEMFGDVNACDSDHNKLLFEELHRLIKRHIKNGNNVIYDATNINAKRRMAFLRELEGIDCMKNAVIFAVPFADCLYRNWHRERKVPYEVIERMYKSWWTPAYFEGWDHIEILYSGHDWHQPNYDDYEEYDQNNPHHTLTLGDHMKKMLSVGDNPKSSRITISAAYYHDCGKPFCRVDDEHGISHYYGHENVGAYDVLTGKTGLGDMSELIGAALDMSLLINYHMMPFQWENAKDPEAVRLKYKKLFGDDFFEQLMILHEADKMAK